MRYSFIGVILFVASCSFASSSETWTTPFVFSLDTNALKWALYDYFSQSRYFADLDNKRGYWGEIAVNAS